MHHARFALLAGIGVAALGIAAPVSACVPLAVTCIGGSDCGPSPEERLAQARRDSAEQTRLRSRAAQARLATGRVDVAAELAEMLVPNVRSIYQPWTDCGPIDEYDWADDNETYESYFRRLVAGTPLAEDSPRAYWGWEEWVESAPFGTRCNLEFRGTFAAFLRQAMRPEDLEAAWQFLDARNQGNPRLMHFEYRRRTPPVLWQLDGYWLTEEVNRFVRRRPAGRALQAAVDSFWAEQAPRLGDDRLICPAFSAQWATERERMVAELTAQQPGRRQR